MIDHINKVVQAGFVTPPQHRDAELLHHELVELRQTTLAQKQAFTSQI